MRQELHARQLRGKQAEHRFGGPVPLEDKAVGTESYDGIKGSIQDGALLRFAAAQGVFGFGLCMGGPGSRCHVADQADLGRRPTPGLGRVHVEDAGKLGVLDQGGNDQGLGADALPGVQMFLPDARIAIAFINHQNLAIAQQGDNGWTEGIEHPRLARERAHAAGPILLHAHDLAIMDDIAKACPPRMQVPAQQFGGNSGCRLRRSSPAQGRFQIQKKLQSFLGGRDRIRQSRVPLNATLASMPAPEERASQISLFAVWSRATQLQAAKAFRLSQC